MNLNDNFILITFIFDMIIIFNVSVISVVKSIKEIIKNKEKDKK